MEGIEKQKLEAIHDELARVLTDYENGEIHIHGMKSSWMHGIVPVGERVSPCRMPEITEVKFKNE